MAHQDGLTRRFRREVSLARTEDEKNDLEQRMIAFSEIVQRTKQKVVLSKEKITPLEMVMKAPTAEYLASKGLTVRQLLTFYDHYLMQGRIRSGTKTEDVVRNIILPETCDHPSCYMDSNFMQSIGGAQRASKLVSHAWISPFSNTVLNIVLDALEWSRVDLIESLDRGLFDTPYFDRRRGVLNAMKLMKDMSANDLDKKYWLCIFGINQHRGICGECQQCKKSEKWKMQESELLVANPCMLCGKKKYAPCICATPKHSKLDPLYELDVFSSLLKRVDGLVVSLDPMMKVMKRAWVVSEIGEAAACSSVSFRCAQGLGRTALKKLNSFSSFLDSIIYCDATLLDDKIRIIKDAQKRHGENLAHHDTFFNCFFEIHIGRLLRMPMLSHTGLSMMARISKLEMNYSWNQYMNSELLELEVGEHHATENFSKFKQLRHLVVNFERCWSLEIVAMAFMQGVASLHSLKTLSISFRDCRSLMSIDALGIGLSRIQAAKKESHVQVEYEGASYEGVIKGLPDEDPTGADRYKVHCVGDPEDVFTMTEHVPYQGEVLTELTLSFRGCAQLASVDMLGRGLKNLQGLKKLSLSCRDCFTLLCVEELGVGLAHLHMLNFLAIDFTCCRSLTSVDAIGKALAQLTSLTSLELNFYECQKLESVDELGRGLASSKDLKSLALHFGRRGEVAIEELGRQWHTAFDSVDEIGKSIAELQSLTSLTLNLPLTRITSIDELSKALSKLRALDSLRLSLEGCKEIASFTELRNALSQIHALSDFMLDVQHCSKLPGHLRKHFGSLEALRKAFSSKVVEKFRM